MSEYNWPWEIKSAVSAFESDMEWQVLAVAVDGTHTFYEVKSKLGADDSSVDDAVRNLVQGGLINKRSTGDPTDPRDPADRAGGRS